MFYCNVCNLIWLHAHCGDDAKLIYCAALKWRIFRSLNIFMALYRNKSVSSMGKLKQPFEAPLCIWQTTVRAADGLVNGSCYFNFTFFTLRLFLVAGALWHYLFSFSVNVWALLFIKEYNNQSLLYTDNWAYFFIATYKLWKGSDLILSNLTCLKIRLLFCRFCTMV